jgi:hypothetical protein
MLCIYDILGMLQQNCTKCHAVTNVHQNETCQFWTFCLQTCSSCEGHS